MKVLLKGKEFELLEEEVKQLKDVAMVESVKYFNLINDKNLREFAKKMWENAPDYFFVIPASSSGKYHAPWATGLGGLVKHVLMGVQVAYDLSFTFKLSDKDTDLALTAMFGHDCLKYGVDFDLRYFDMHPFLPRSYYGDKKSTGYIDHAVLPTPEFDVIMDAIERHMGSLKDGSWASVSRGSGRFKPETDVEKVVHLADYISSRKEITLIDFK